MKLILKAWVRFTDDMDIDCICTDIQCEGCEKDYDCDPYVVKFVPIEDFEVDNKSGNINNELKKLNNELKKTTREVEKINKVNKRFIR